VASANIDSVDSNVTCVLCSMMFLTLEEVVRWLGLSVFELWLHLIGLLMFSILLELRLDSGVELSWWNIFIPLYAADALDTYFCVIVFVRTLRVGNRRAACLRLLSSCIILVCLFVFKLLLCQKLMKENVLSFSEVFASMFVALQILMVRACQANG